VSKHRIEALTDGIFAVAMTLLVIELKLPDAQVPADLANGVAHLIPKFVAWIISFFVLGIFWFSHHRLFHYVKHVDETLVWLSILYLSLVSLMPFSSAITGEFALVLFSQMFYSANMILLAAVALAINRHVCRHAALQGEPMSAGFYRGVRFRMVGLMVIAAATVGIARVLPGAGNVAFLLMWPISIVSRHIERRAV
jgi:uncharacterized membrane protein